jgi:hypothetical protein
VIFEPGKNFYFWTYPSPTSIHLSHRLTSAQKPVEYKSFDYFLSQFRTSVSTYSSSAKHLPPNCEPLYVTNTSHRKQETFQPLQSPFAHGTLLFYSKLLKHGRHFDYWNQHVNMCRSVSYIDCHETGLCCYLVLRIENLLLPLHRFYFHLWSIYWCSLAISSGVSTVGTS